MVGYDIYFPAAVFCITAVHPIKITGKQGGLFPSGAVPDLDDDVFLIIGIFGQQKLFKLGFKIVFDPVQCRNLIPRQIFYIRISVL